MTFGIPTLRVVTESTTHIRSAAESSARIIISGGDLTDSPSLLSARITLPEAYHVESDTTVHDYTFTPATVYTFGGTIHVQTPTGEVVSLSERDQWDGTDVSQASLSADFQD